jgi:hypothetical protein
LRKYFGTVVSVRKVRCSLTHSHRWLDKITSRRRITSKNL